MEGDHQLIIDGKPQWRYKFYPVDSIPESIKLIVVDEGSMVPGYMAKWLLRYDVPIIVLGDLNQLPPVGGNSYFLKKPDAILTQIMRQADDSPIPYIAQYAIQGVSEMFNTPLNIDDKVVIKKAKELSDDEMVNADVYLCRTNKERDSINNYVRHDLHGITAKYPVIGDKVICRENNWQESIHGDIFLTNGMVGYVHDIDLESITDRKMKIDFRPEFLDTDVFRNLEIDRVYMRLSPEYKKKYNSTLNKFEYAYAITCHLAQGSQYKHVIVDASSIWGLNAITNRQWLYTAITRAIDKVTIIY
jgi:exodeoxyribonuclease-5